MLGAEVEDPAADFFPSLGITNVMASNLAFPSCACPLDDVKSCDSNQKTGLDDDGFGISSEQEERISKLRLRELVPRIRDCKREIDFSIVK